MSSHPPFQVHRKGARPDKPARLKDSCTACANSKLKCDKEKPVCKRCERKGLTCEYQTSKRAGRTSHATKAAHLVAQVRQQSQADDKVRQRQREANEKAHEPQHLPSNLQPLRSSQQHESPQAPAPTAVMVSSSDPHPPSPLGRCEIATPFQDPSQDPYAWLDWWADVNNFDPSVPLPALDPFASSPPPQDANGHDLMGLSFEPPEPLESHPAASSEQPTVTMEKGSTDLVTSHGLSSQSTSHHDERYNTSSSSASTLNFQEIMNHCNLSLADPITSVESANCCFCVAVAFLVRLSPNTASLCSTAGAAASNSSGLDSTPTAQSIIDENRHIFDGLSKIWDCPSSCLQDGCLLTIVALLLFKAMSRYSGILGESSSGNDDTHLRATDSDLPTANTRRGLRHTHSHHSMSSVPPPDGAVSAARHNSARAILGELHRVQRVVNLLSQRIRALQELDKDDQSPGASSRKQDNASSHNHSAGKITSRTTLMSSGSLYQLEADLRECLGQTSSDVIEILRTSHSAEGGLPMGRYMDRDRYR